MLAFKPYPTPMVSNTRLHQNSSEMFSDPTLYRFVVDNLQYLIVTHPELSYFFNKVTQFMHSPQHHHWQFVKRP